MGGHVKWIQDYEDAFTELSLLVQKTWNDDEIKKRRFLQDSFFHRNYRGGLVEWIQDYEDAFTVLPLLGQKTWNDDEIKKRCHVQNAQNIGLVDTFFEEVVSDKSFYRNLQFP
jgi:hypothetical protein